MAHRNAAPSKISGTTLISFELLTMAEHAVIGMPPPIILVWMEMLRLAMTDGELHDYGIKYKSDARESRFSR